jgi:hypothetical protein
MDQLDCIIVGNDVSSLFAALFLARKMRRILVFHDKAVSQPKRHQIVFKDDLPSPVTVNLPPEDSVPGLGEGGLTLALIRECGFTEPPKTVDDLYGVVVEADGMMRKRILRAEQFRVDLIRRYPKSREAILAFFRDGERLVQNYRAQQQGMLKNTEYTISSFMIEWGDYSVEELLNKYFKDPGLIDEFSLDPAVSGLDPASLSAYDFFVSFFLGLHEGRQYWLENESSLMKKILAKIAIIQPKAVVHGRIASFVPDVNGRILKVIAEDGKEYAARHFIVADHPGAFYPRYFQKSLAPMEKLEGYLGRMDQAKRTRSLICLLQAEPESLGLDRIGYLFHGRKEEAPFQIVRLTVLKPLNKDLKTPCVAVDVVYDEGATFDENDVLAKWSETMPKLAKIVAAKAFGPERVKQGVLIESSLRKGLSINEQIEIENGEKLKLFENLWLTGPWHRPEAGWFGQIHSGVAYADAIEEHLTYGDDDDSFYYLTNDEIMMMIRHNFKPGAIGTTERHLNFHVGKAHYYIRTKAKNIQIHHGSNAHPDLEIYTTNDALSNLLLKKASLQDVLSSGVLRYVGEENFLYEVVNGFALDDFKEYDPSFKPQSKIYFLGVKFLFAYFTIWLFQAFFVNYLPVLWIAPFAVLLTGATLVLKRKVFKHTHWFEWTVLGMSAFFLILAIAWPAFANANNDDYFLGSMGVLLFVTAMFDQGIVYPFHRLDYQTDYATTKLFQIICNGLTFVWSFVFLGVLIFTYVTGERYVSALYFLAFVGYFLTYYYPVMYVKTNIKK